MNYPACSPSDMSRSTVLHYRTILHGRSYFGNWHIAAADSVEIRSSRESAFGGRADFAARRCYGRSWRQADMARKRSNAGLADRIAHPGHNSSPSLANRQRLLGLFRTRVSPLVDDRLDDAGAARLGPARRPTPASKPVGTAQTAFLEGQGRGLPLGISCQKQSLRNPPRRSSGARRRATRRFRARREMDSPPSRLGSARRAAAPPDREAL